jgi:hypothetical protein
VDYLLLPEAGYAQERYLKDHPDFYDVINEKRGWSTDIDFAKVPTEKVESLYNEYLKQSEGTGRKNFRLAHPELDAWLVLAKGYKPVT